MCNIISQNDIAIYIYIAEHYSSITYTITIENHRFMLTEGSLISAAVVYLYA